MKITKDNMHIEYIEPWGLIKELTMSQGLSDEQYVEHCKKLSSNAKIIKVADILANITDNGHKSDHFIRKRVTALKVLLE